MNLGRVQISDLTWTILNHSGLRLRCTSPTSTTGSYSPAAYLNSSLVVDSSTSILIVGGGAWGLSTAWHLAQRGYKNVTCIDPFAYPSPDSAGDDINKMVRTEYGNPEFMQRVTGDALNEWRSNPIFGKVFHETGRLSIASFPSNYDELRQYHEELLSAPHADRVKWFDTPREIQAFAPYLAGIRPEAKAVFNPEGGWVHSRESMRIVGEQCEGLGVKFVSGPSGRATSLIVNSAGDAVIGVRCADGTEHYAQRVVLAAGAWSPLLLDMQDQLVTKCWTLGHIPITDRAERRLLKGIPVTFDTEKGFFFEPDENGLVKVCNEFAGFTNWKDVTIQGRRQMLSVPRGKGTYPTDTVPYRAYDEIREVVSHLRPSWTNNTAMYPLVDEKMCWCADTPDRNYLITLHPKYGNSLVLATGDSGQGFVVLPTVGRYVADLVEGKELDEDLRWAWRWRPETAVGDRPSYRSRPGKGGDLNEEEGWKGEAFEEVQVVVTDGSGDVKEDAEYVPPPPVVPPVGNGDAKKEEKKVPPPPSSGEPNSLLFWATVTLAHVGIVAAAWAFTTYVVSRRRK